MKDITYAFPKIKEMDPSCYIDVYNLILECSQAHSPRSFTIKLLDLLGKVCDYDQAMAFFLDANGKVSGKYLINVKENWVDEYINYYLNSGECPQEFSLYQGFYEDISKYTFSNILDWSEFPQSNFLKEYVNPQGLKYSWGFCFFDLNGAYRVVISLDRTRDEPFSEIECKRLKLALPVLNNMYRNFYYQGTDSDSHKMQSSWSEYNFTKRETEIANLLCQGMSIQNISLALYIAKTTTYKHIAHIYEKVGVSSQQELLFKIMNL